MKKGKLSFIIVMSLVLLFVGLIILGTPKTIEKKNYYTKDLGLVEQKLTECNIICKISNLFNPSKQAWFTNLPSKSYVGDTITIREELTISKARCLLEGKVNDMFVIVYKDGVEYRRLPSIYSASGTTCEDDRSFTNTVTFSPSVAGTYTLKTAVTRRTPSALNPPVIIDYCTQQCSGVVTCKCSLTIYDRQQIPPCSKTPGWIGWTLAQNIPNGIRQYNSYREVSTSCEWLPSDRPIQMRTVCNSGYTCDGSNTICGEYANCNRAEIEPPIEPPTECEEGSETTDTCEDESVIVIKKCIGGELVPTGNVCPNGSPIDGDDGDDEDDNYTAGYNYIEEDNECIRVESNAQYATLEDCVKNIKTNTMLIVFISAGIIALIIITILIVKIVKK